MNPRSHHRWHHDMVFSAVRVLHRHTVNSPNRRHLAALSPPTRPPRQQQACARRLPELASNLGGGPRSGGNVEIREHI